MPFVALARAARSLGELRGRLVLLGMRLTTQGAKGRRIRLGRRVRVTPGGHLDLGHDATIGDGCRFEIGLSPAARITVGPGTWISHDCHFRAVRRIEVGANVLIGEFVSIRDSSHAHADPDVPIRSQGDVGGPITIEDDVWLGRGSVILGRPEGIVIGRGAIVGANSVVTRSVPPRTIVVGAPARTLRSRA